MRIGGQMLNAIGVDGARLPDKPVHLIALAEQKLG
jgi:hypothetical protein